MFSPGENEFDVVGLHRTASPKIVLEVGATKFVPFDGIAFIIQVKQTLKKDSLETDLIKLNKLNELDWSDRFGAKFYGKMSIERHLKLLFSYEKNIKDETMNELLEKYNQAWDMLVIFE